jgi:hypothetical protein
VEGVVLIIRVRNEQQRRQGIDGYLVPVISMSWAKGSTAGGDKK